MSRIVATLMLVGLGLGSLQGADLPVAPRTVFVLEKKVRLAVLEETMTVSDDLLKKEVAKGKDADPEKVKNYKGFDASYKDVLTRQVSGKTTYQDDVSILNMVLFLRENGKFTDPFLTQSQLKAIVVATSYYGALLKIEEIKVKLDKEGKLAAKIDDVLPKLNLYVAKAKSSDKIDADVENAAIMVFMLASEQFNYVAPPQLDASLKRKR